ncbi:cytochrome b5 domain-containing protein 1 [Schistocerca cancellata]|uniref:cytochrome b5 domain-containing protein 1 n=1 Tax=Schistocerca cancellata TaxID=274614 RepID=UPI0021185829|nr:cytochrome b5 domain-containing protein 1 [Schistocerca cancellata]
MSSSLPYFTPSEVYVHNTPDDIWVSFLGKIYDLTPLVKQYEGSDIIKPILANAGKDISHWFQKETGQIRHYIHPIIDVSVPYAPHGPLPHIGPQVPTTAWRQLTHPPWWEDKKLIVGNLTKRARPIRLRNMNTGEQFTLTVCCEDKLKRIVERALPFNTHGFSYTYKFEGRVLDFNKTLHDNGIPDERDRYLSVGLDENYFIPALAMYFNDDLTVA